MRKRKRVKAGKYARYFHERRASPRRFDKRSFRTKAVGKRGRKIVVACRKGAWMPRKKRCRKGMRLQSILRPKPVLRRRKKGAKVRMGIWGRSRAANAAAGRFANRRKARNYFGIVETVAREYLVSGPGFIEKFKSIYAAKKFMEQHWRTSGEKSSLARRDDGGEWVVFLKYTGKWTRAARLLFR